MTISQAGKSEQSCPPRGANRREAHSGAYDVESIRRSAAGAKLEQIIQGTVEVGESLPGGKPDLVQIVERIIRDCSDPVQVLELFHWTRQPGLREAIRVLALLPAETRATIQTFLALVQNPDKIEVVLNESGELKLFSQEVAANLKAFNKAVS